MAHISHRLSNSFEGALAGGGDPATSPLYVFGPFLQLIVVAGVAQITFGASVWLVVLTVAVVSSMYRQVIRWVTDGTGGSGGGIWRLGRQGQCGDHLRRIYLDVPGQRGRAGDVVS